MSFLIESARKPQPFIELAPEDMAKISGGGAMLSDGKTTCTHSKSGSPGNDKITTNDP